MKFQCNKRMRGYSLVELIIYMALMTVLLAGVVQSTLLLTQGYRNVKAVRNIENSAIYSMDRMVREIRNAKSVDGSQTTYNSAAGSLKLNTTDDVGTAQTVRFYLSGGKLMLQRNGADIGPLSVSSANVSSLIFRLISTSTSQAIKIELTVESGTSTAYFTKNFYETATIRGTY